MGLVMSLVITIAIPAAGIVIADKHCKKIHVKNCKHAKKSGELQVIQRSADQFSHPSTIPPFDRLLIKSEAKCNSDEIVVGGGFDTGANEFSKGDPVNVVASFASNNSWTAIADSLSSDPSGEIKAFAECAKIIH
jgi:hypothetical protein